MLSHMFYLGTLGRKMRKKLFVELSLSDFYYSINSEFPMNNFISIHNFDSSDQENGGDIIFSWKVMNIFSLEINHSIRDEQNFFTSIVITLSITDEKRQMRRKANEIMSIKIVSRGLSIQLHFLFS